MTLVCRSSSNRPFTIAMIINSHDTDYDINNFLIKAAVRLS